MAYCEDFRGGIWNAQGLFAREISRHQKKWAKNYGLLMNLDFVILSVYI